MYKNYLGTHRDLIHPQIVYSLSGTFQINIKHLFPLCQSHSRATLGSIQENPALWPPLGLYLCSDKIISLFKNEQINNNHKLDWNLKMGIGCFRYSNNWYVKSLLMCSMPIILKKYYLEGKRYLSKQLELLVRWFEEQCDSSVT